MTPRACFAVLTGLIAPLAATPAAATHPELACGHFALVEPLVLPREALVVHTVSLRADDVVLNGECVARHARVRRRPDGGARFIAVFGGCGRARGVKVRGATDAACGVMRGRMSARRPVFRARFDAVAVSEHTCGPDPVCVPGSFCEVPSGVCAANGAAGACVRVPDACPDVVDPVCGCDGVTYGNDCERRAGGVSQSHGGPCECTPILCPPDTRPRDSDDDGCDDECVARDACFRDDDCPYADSYCRFELGACAAPGTCQTIPVDCRPTVDPVCGCDERTHTNAC